MIDHSDLRFNGTSYSIERSSLLQSGRVDFIPAYIAFDILEKALSPAPTKLTSTWSCFDEIPVYCECGSKMFVEEAAFRCPRCGSDNWVAHKELMIILQSELHIFLETLQGELSALHNRGMEGREEYISEYQKMFDANLNEQLSISLQNCKKAGDVSDLQIDALLDRASAFQCAVTKLSPIWWQSQFNKRLENLIAYEISDELIEMQIRCVMVGRVRNHRRLIKIAYSLPF